MALSEEKRAEIVTLWASLKNKSKISDLVGVSEGTVRNVIKKLESDEDYINIYERSRSKFVEKSTTVIDMAFDRLIEKLSVPNRDVTVNQLSTVIGTLFDKRALAVGDSTENSKITVELSKEAAEYAK